MTSLARLFSISVLAIVLLASCDQRPSAQLPRNRRGTVDIPDQVAACAARRLDTSGWTHVVARDAPFAIRLPAGFDEVPNSPKQIWRLSFGTVGYLLTERSPRWLDSVLGKSSPSSYSLCVDSTEAGIAWVHPYYGETHFGRGQYLTAYWWLPDGRELSLIAFSRDSSARDTLFAIARSLRFGRQ